MLANRLLSRALQLTSELHTPVGEHAAREQVELLVDASCDTTSDERADADAASQTSAVAPRARGVARRARGTACASSNACELVRRIFARA